MKNPASVRVTVTAATAQPLQLQPLPPMPDFYQEIDPSPLAYQAMQMLAEENASRPVCLGHWEVFCSLNPSAIECRVYED